jgi:CelD/BcsL family acetyltransferase involved in cellulose biosynthesis
VSVAAARGAAPTEVLDLAHVVDGAGELRDEWNALAAQCPGTSYFQTADWVWSWWETVARRPPTRVACWRAPDGVLQAVAAVSAGRVMLHRRLGLSVRAMTLAGTGPGDADHCGAVARTDRRADVARWLRDIADRRTLVAEALAPVDGIAPRGARLLERMPCPCLTVTSANAPCGSSAHRSQLRKYARRAARAGIVFEWLPPSSVTPATVDALFELHSARRQSRRKSTTLGPLHRELLLQCCARAGVDRGPVAAVARRGDELIGVLLGFGWQRSVALYQKGWDPQYASFNIGSLLVAEAVDAAVGRGAASVDFLRGTEDYKFRFGAVVRDDRTMVVPSGAVGALLVARSRVMTRREARAPWRRTAVDLHPVT